MIKTLCSVDGTCLIRDSSIVASESVGSNTFAFLRGTEDTDYRPCSHARQGLSVLENIMSTPMASESIGLNEAQENCITAVAKKMNRWLMDVPLKVGPRVPGYAFKSDLSEDADQSGLRMGHLLVNNPRLSHIKTGKFEMSGPVFRESDVAYETAETAYNEEWLPFSAGSANVLSNFRYAETTLKDMMVVYKCSNCGKDGGELQACKRSCLRHSAVGRLFLLLAHAIADGFGAQNVSAMVDPETQIKGMVELFSELIYQQIVCWNAWFCLVACVVAGYDMEVFETTDVSHSGGSSWAAIQYGSFVAAAPWLDLTREITVAGSFGLTFLEGNIKGFTRRFRNPKI